MENWGSDCSIELNWSFCLNEMTDVKIKSVEDHVEIAWGLKCSEI